MKNLRDAHRRFTHLVYRVTGSMKLFWAAVIAAAVQAVWLVFSGIFPLPFDEFVHFNAIRFLSEQWGPFLAIQPAGTGVFGDMTREPSFLYYYLMTFPHRILDIFIDSEALMIIGLRLVNVVFLALGMIFFAKLLRRWGWSQRLINLAALAFAFTHIIPFVGAHINYDNLLFTLTPLFLLAATKLLEDTHGRQLIRNSLLFIFLAISALTVKQTILPLLVVTTLYVGVILLYRHKARLPAAYVASWKHTARDRMFALLCAGLIVTGGMFVARYAGNMITYGSIRPDCDKVQPVSFCRDFGPWRRDNITNNKPGLRKYAYGNPASFTQYWGERVMKGFFAMFGHNPTMATQLEPFGPISGRWSVPVPLVTAYVVLAAGIIFTLRHIKRYWEQPYMRFGIIVSVGYVAAVWTFNYQTYLDLGRAQAIQARYLYPVLFILMAVIAQSLAWSIPRRARAYVVGLFALVYIWGGGIAGWIVRAPDTWKWQNPTVQSVNQETAKVLRKIMITQPGL